VLRSSTRVCAAGCWVDSWCVVEMRCFAMQYLCRNQNGRNVKAVRVCKLEHIFLLSLG